MGCFHRLSSRTGMMLIFVLLQAMTLAKYANEEKGKQLMYTLTSAPRFALPSRKRGERSEGGEARQTRKAL